VLAGVSTYAYLEPLPAVANNLPALAAALKSADGWGLSARHCTVIADPSDGHRVADALWNQAQEATGTLLFYFAGHGLIDSRGELLLALPDSRPGLSHRGMPYHWLRDAMAEGRAKRYVVILDCCFSGRALGLMSSPGDLADTAQIDGSYLLAAAGENATALAPPGEQHTAFTGELLRVFTDGIPGGPAELDLDTVYHHLRRRLAAQGAARPAQTRPQHRRSPHPGPQHRPPARGRTSPGETRAGGSGAVAGSGDVLHTRRLPPRPGHGPRRGQSAADHRRRPRRPVRGHHRHPGQPQHLPARWTTTGAYLNACGLTDEQTAAWKQAWQRLRALPPPLHQTARPHRPRLLPREPGARTVRGGGARAERRAAGPCLLFGRGG
jgi:hypothetical protein